MEPEAVIDGRYICEENSGRGCHGGGVVMVSEGVLDVVVR